MDGSAHFRSAYLAWLVLIRDRLEAMESVDGESDGLVQSREFTRELWRLRQECQLLHRTVQIQRLTGQLVHDLEARTSAFLHDLRWLLDISPSAPPALARQCLRIAQDRIFEEAQQESADMSAEMAQGWKDSCAVA
jgi:hypothetical protein